MPTTLTISSKNYSSWSLRGWLMCKFAGLPFEEYILPSTDASARAELLHLSPSFLVPCLEHEGVRVWDALAIGEYLAEAYPGAGLLPDDPAERAHCRSICAEMHGGFTNLRSALPMNLRVRFENFKVWPGVRADIARVVAIWTECFERFSGGTYLFGTRSMADAMYAPVAARFLTYGVDLDERCRRYCEDLAAMPEMREWADAARLEIDDFEELDAEF